MQEDKQLQEQLAKEAQERAIYDATSRGNRRRATPLLLRLGRPPRPVYGLCWIVKNTRRSPGTRSRATRGPAWRRARVPSTICYAGWPQISRRPEE